MNRNLVIINLQGYDGVEGCSGSQWAAAEVVWSSKSNVRPLLNSEGAAHELLRLYCTNLPEKLQKSDLKLSLYTLFSTYGPVLDVVALKTSKMRGQAHIVYRDVQASTQAMRALQGFDFFGKEMVSKSFRLWIIYGC